MNTNINHVHILALVWAIPNYIQIWAIFVLKRDYVHPLFSGDKKMPETAFTNSTGPDTAEAIGRTVEEDVDRREGETRTSAG